MMIGTDKNKKIFFGFHRDDAWIEAGSGAAHFKGEVSVSNSIKVTSNGVTLEIGENQGMPGITSSGDGVARDLMLATGAGKKVYFGHVREDAYVETGTGNAWFKGEVKSEQRTEQKKQDDYSKESADLNDSIDGKSDAIGVNDENINTRFH